MKSKLPFLLLTLLLASPSVLQAQQPPEDRAGSDNSPAAGTPGSAVMDGQNDSDPTGAGPAVGRPDNKNPQTLGHPAYQHPVRRAAVPRPNTRPAGAGPLLPEDHWPAPVPQELEAGSYYHDFNAYVSQAGNAAQRLTQPKDTCGTVTSVSEGESVTIPAWGYRPAVTVPKSISFVIASRWAGTAVSKPVSVRVEMTDANGRVNSSCAKAWEYMQYLANAAKWSYSGDDNKFCVKFSQNGGKTQFYYAGFDDDEAHWHYLAGGTCR